MRICPLTSTALWAVRSALNRKGKSTVRSLESASGKPHGDGMSFDAFQSSPLAVESIIRPELSRIHEGIALRDAAWEEAHHNQPHTVYLSATSGIKVGQTRDTNIPPAGSTRGQRCVGARPNPIRQLAGLIEVAMKDHLPTSSGGPCSPLATGPGCDRGRIDGGTR